MNLRPKDRASRTRRLQRPSYDQQEREELLEEGITLLSVKRHQTPSIDEHEAWRIAQERLLQMGFPRLIGPIHLPLARVRKRPNSAHTVSWERLCWVARAETADVRGPHHRLVRPRYQRAGIVILDAETGEVLLSKAWERETTGG